jgi:subtilase family serine protease
MKISGLLISTALTALALAAPALSKPQFPAGSVVADANPSATVGFEVFLPLRNKAAMQALLKAQQTPGSPQYHAWLTPAQFGAQFGPDPASVARVKSALTAAGLTVAAVNPRSIRVSGTAQQAKAILGGGLKSVTTPAGTKSLVMLGGPALSAALKAEGAQVVSFAPVAQKHPTAMKGPLAPAAAVASAAPANRYTDVGAYWFDDDKQAYSYPAYSQSTKLAGGFTQVTYVDGTGVNVAVLMSDLLFPGDVQSAFTHEKFTTYSSGRPIPVVSTVLVDGGGQYNGGGSFEASLDVQQVTGGAPGSKVTLVSIPDLSDGSIIDGYAYIVDSNQYAIVNSSFGGCELEYTPAYNGGFDYTFILQIEDELFAQGNLQGITFVASSGDNGAVMCPGVNYAPGVDSTFGVGVSTPAADPNVTAVGGGNLVTSAGPGLNSTYVRESAFGDPEYPYDIYGIGANVSGGYWAAGGGVSVVFAQPWYQTGVNTGSSVARTVPDVGMQVGGLGFSMLNGSAPGFCNGNAISCSADDSSVLTAFGVNYGGGFYFTIGTSVSSPEFVGALALYEQRAGRQGNVNPLLYAAGAAQTANGGPSAPAAYQFFHRGMQGFDGAYQGGFPSPNYDYIYGNGSPNVAKLFGLTGFGSAGAPQTTSNP